MTTIGELCGRTVWIASPGETVLAAAQRMRDHHVGCLVVVEEREGVRIPIGMLTDRDIAVRVIAEEGDPASVCVADAMTKPLVKAREPEPLEDVVSRMRAFGVRRVPVVAHDEALQGIVSLDDLLEYLADQIAALARLFPREQERERVSVPSEAASPRASSSRKERDTAKVATTPRPRPDGRGARAPRSTRRGSTPR